MDLLLPLLRSFTIRRRMQGAILVVLLMFALIGAAALIGGYRLKTLNTEFMDHSMAELEAVGELSVAVAEVRRFEKDMVLGYDDAAAVQAHRAEWQAATVRVRERLETLLHGEEDDDNVLARESLQSLKAYIDATEPVVAMILKGGFDTAQVADKRLDRAKEHVAQVEERTDRIADIVHAEALASRAEFDQAMQYTLYAFVAVLAVVVLFVVPTTLANSRSIVGPIEEARMIARAIADGDLTRPIRVDGRDELSELDRALEAMQASLGRVVGEVRASSDGIRTASAEIASGNQDLSTRTEQAASNLQQTASSMEQITGTVRQSAEAASTANQLASSAAAVAAKGGEVVSRVVSTMDEINVSSRRIGDIIGVIDGIAFQTNILALNAAVEAARAGEQGRGFAVVAGEVRSLAQRSATAAREIKGLIDASVGKVADGARLVGDAGTTMNEIVASVQRVTDVIAEISSSTSEQSQGLGQVNTAVGHLDQMTQQNAALVEESAAAAQSLRDQAGRLAELVSGFRLQPARG